MATVGRPRNPLRTGAKRGRPRKENPFTLKPGTPEAPEYVEADSMAFAEWIRICGLLDKEKRCSELFMASIAQYCMKYADWRWAREKIQDTYRGRTMVGKTGNKREIKNPWLDYESRCFAELMKAAAEIGITPVTQAKVEAIPQRKGDDEPRDSDNPNSLDSFIGQLPETAH